MSWEAGSEIVLEKNANYWQEGKPHFERFIYKIVEEGTTRVTGLKTGEISMMTQVPPDQLEAVMGFDNIDFQEVVGYTINRVDLRNDRPPFRRCEHPQGRLLRHRSQSDYGKYCRRDRRAGPKHGCAPEYAR